MSKVVKLEDYREAKERDNMEIMGPERFFLKNDGSLERLIGSAEFDEERFPEGYILVPDPGRTSHYVEQNGVLKSVNEVPEGQTPYKFRGDIKIY